MSLISALHVAFHMKFLFYSCNSSKRAVKVSRLRVSRTKHGSEITAENFNIEEREDPAGSPSKAQNCGEVEQTSPCKDLVATPTNQELDGRLDPTQSGLSLRKSRNGEPSTANLQTLHCAVAEIERVPDRDPSTTDIVSQEVLARSHQAEKSINIPRESLPSQQTQSALPVANPDHCFRVLDILLDGKEDESDRKSSTEPYAAFASKGYGRNDPRTPEHPLQRLLVSVPSKRVLGTSYPKVKTLPSVGIADQRLQLSKPQLAVRAKVRDHSYCSKSDSEKGSDLRWTLAERNTNRIASPRLDLRLYQDATAQIPDYGNSNIPPQIKVKNSPAYFLETSWDLSVTPNVKLISLHGPNTDHSYCQYSEQRPPNLEELLQSWGHDVLEYDNPVQTCHFGSNARASSEETPSSNEEVVGFWDSDFLDQDSPIGTYQRGPRAGTGLGETLLNSEDITGSWDSDFLERVSPARTCQFGAKAGTGSEESLMNLDEEVRFWDPGHLNSPSGNFELGSKAKRRSGEGPKSFEDAVLSWDFNFLEQNEFIRTCKPDSKARTSSEDSLINFEDVFGSWDSDFLTQDTPARTSEIRFETGTNMDPSLINFEDVGPSDFLELHYRAKRCKINPDARSNSQDNLFNFEDVGGSWDSDIVKEDYPAGSYETGSLAEPCSEQRLRTFEDDVGSWESDSLKQDNLPVTRQLGSEAISNAISLPMFDDIGPWDSGFLDQETSAGTYETGHEARTWSEERLPRSFGSFGVFVML